MIQLVKIINKIIYHYKIGGILGIVMQLHNRIPIPLPPKWKWRMGIAYEIEFWRKVFNQENEYWPTFKQRLNPNRPIEGTLNKLLAEIDTTKIEILDVGAGPLTVLSVGGLIGKPIIRACDALAKEYDKILAYFNIEPTIHTGFCIAEELRETYNPNSFDIVYSRNALDHCYDPVKVVHQMVCIIKPGGFILIEGKRNEATHQKWQGLHQWNFDIDATGDFVISNKKNNISMRENLKHKAFIKANVNADSLVVIIRKDYKANDIVMEQSNP
jgi:SAM-dependent methyltransferase